MDDANRPGTPRATVETEPSRRSWGGRRVGDGPEWAAWSWSSGGRRFPLMGILLVVLGAALLIQYLLPGVSLASLFILAVGLAFGAGWLLGGVRALFVPAALLVALAAARLGSELGYLVGSGWTPLLLGVAFLAAWLVGRLQGASRGWAAWIGAILALVGLAQLSNRIPGLTDLGLIWPVLIILVGGYLLLRTRMNFGRPSRDERPSLR